MSNGADPTSGHPRSRSRHVCVRSPRHRVVIRCTRVSILGVCHVLQPTVARARTARPRPARVWLAGAVVGATVGGVLAAAAVLATPAQALGEVPVQCANQKVVIETDGLSYQLQGTCGVVVVKADDTVVDVPASRRLVVRGHGNTVTARPGDRVLVRGHGNQVRVESTRVLVADSPGSRVRIIGLVETARVSGRDLRLAARQITDLRVAGRRHDVTARRGYDARVPGNGNRVELRRLDTLGIGGDHNTVVVRRYATTVSDSGVGNTVRVNRRR